MMITGHKGSIRISHTPAPGPAEGAVPTPAERSDAPSRSSAALAGGYPIERDGGQGRWARLLPETDPCLVAVAA